MILSFDDIRSILHGAVRCCEKDGILYAYRFTEEQMAAYEKYNDDFFKKTKATAGVRLEFYTNSQALRIKGQVLRASSRDFFGFDFSVNGALVCHKHGYFGEDITYDFEVKLGEGDKKKVTVYLPWSAQATISSFELDDGAYFENVERPYKMICFGDSITQGYTAHNPSFTYATRLSDLLLADSVNKGIGGEVFFPTLAALKDDIDPDIITVAYGTNDWSHAGKEDFEERAKLFFEALSANYPNAKIFALAPIWRGNYNTKKTPIGDFSNVAKQLQKIAATLPNAIFIDCFDFIPHDADFYVEDILHPNDAGFAHYAAELYNAIKKQI